ncbi:MAG: tetratricopeptide repeat protein [Planctomycetaceae bacterium]|nr:tetratricopeptide repeat protein [Planctomycetaceae bacterium]
MKNESRESRSELLLQTAADLLQEFEELSRRFASYKQQATAVVAMRQIQDLVRETLKELVSQVSRSVGLAEMGAKLLCTAVRLNESVFSAEERIAWIEAFRQRSSEFQDRQLTGKLLGNLGNALADTGRLDDADRVLQERLAEAKAQQDNLAESLAQEHLGKLCLRRGHVLDAVPLLEAAFAASRCRQDTVAIGRLMVEIAELRFRQGDIEGGLHLLRERLAHQEQGGDTQYTLTTCQRLAERLGDLGRIDEAQRYAERGLELAKTLRLPIRRASIMGTLGNLAYERNDFTEARRLFSEARKIFRRHGRIVEQGTTATSLGLVAWKERRLKLAGSWFRRALEIDKVTGRQGDLVIDLGNLAEICAETQQFDESVAFYEQRIEILKSLGQFKRKAETETNLAEVLARAGRIDEAMARARDSLSYFSDNDLSRANLISARIQFWTDSENLD